MEAGSRRISPCSLLPGIFGARAQIFRGHRILRRPCLTLDRKKLTGFFRSRSTYLAAGEGFEPSHTESESAVLPLHKPAVSCRTDIIIQKCSFLSRTFFKKFYLFFRGKTAGRLRCCKARNFCRRYAGGRKWTIAGKGKSITFYYINSVILNTFPLFMTFFREF